MTYNLSKAVAVYGFIQRSPRIEPAGLSYEYLWVKERITIGLPTSPVFMTKQIPSRQESDDSEKDDLFDADDKKYRKYMSTLDPTSAKDQDHYRVLGLSTLRYRATPDNIKQAYRKKVLKYHPDKGTEDSKSEMIFSCIQKAYEQLGDTEEKRRAFDSIDPSFDDTVPDSVQDKNFFSSLGPIFEHNSRFSEIQPVPELGDENSNRDHVEHFYDFWFNWRSWREFSYLDEEDKSKGGDRWERREIEKQNKVERERRRKNDFKRISNLVELAYASDPRIRKFKETDKQYKESIKAHKRKQRTEKEQARIKAENEESERIELDKQKQLEEEKRQKQAAAEATKKLNTHRKKLRELARSLDYWTEDHGKKMTVMEQIERICIIADVNELTNICESLREISLYEQAFQRLSECARVKQQDTETDNGKSDDKNVKQAKSCSKWTPSELNALIKATGVYPVGTVERWEKVARYIVDHVPGSLQKSEKEVISQVKQLKSLDRNSDLAARIKSTNPLPFKQDTSIQQQPPTNGNCQHSTDVDAWTADQQRQLEVALRSVPSGDPERWEKVAELVEGKSKKDCIKRYKHLADLVKASKGAKTS